MLTRNKQRVVRKESVIRCRNCQKDIPVPKYRLHMWRCAGTEDINPTIANMFKSQLKMSKQIQDLIRLEQSFSCMYCSQQINKEEQMIHPSQCPSLPVNCGYCSVQFPRDLMTEHEDYYCQKKKFIKEEQQKKLLLAAQNIQKKQLIKPVKMVQLLIDPITSQQFTNQPAVDEHIQFIFRELAECYGVRNSRALSNKDMMNLAQVIYTKDTKSTEDQQIACSVCVIDFKEGQKLVKLPCGHLYHRMCICGWFSTDNRCPMCRHIMDRERRRKKIF